jgi:hypothetical protein
VNHENEHPLTTLLGELRAFSMVPLESEPLPNERSVAERRAGLRSDAEEPVSTLTLLDLRGVLRWHVGTTAAPARVRAGRRAAQRGSETRDDVVAEFKIEDTPPNQIHQKLRDLDASLTPGQGLRTLLRDGKLGSEAGPREKGRILLFVHGTFSNVETMVKEIAVTQPGRAFLNDAHAQYDQVLALNHPTLSVSPVLNAAKLGQLFRGSKAEVDVICHSRGGLVTRWWREVLDQPGRLGETVFVGSPLQGTGLAAPARLKTALDVLTNLANALTTASKVGGAVFPMALPLWKASSVLFGFFGKLMQLAARTPVLDAGVALIPGLAAQSMESANGELLHARDYFSSFPDDERRRRVDSYRFVTSNFETEDPGWKFWRYFRKSKLMDAGADAVFEGENDLVVDTPNMTSLAEVQPRIRPEHVLAFDKTQLVTHVGYFQRTEAIEFLRKQLL